MVNSENYPVSNPFFKIRGRVLIEVSAMLKLIQLTTASGLAFLMGTELAGRPSVQALPNSAEEADQIIIICETGDTLENCWGFFPLSLTEPKRETESQFSFAPVELETFSTEDHNEKVTEFKIWQVQEEVDPTPVEEENVQEEKNPWHTSPDGYLW